MKEQAYFIRRVPSAFRRLTGIRFRIVARDTGAILGVAESKKDAQDQIARWTR